MKKVILAAATAAAFGLTMAATAPASAAAARGGKADPAPAPVAHGAAAGGQAADGSMLNSLYDATMRGIRLSEDVANRLLEEASKDAKKAPEAQAAPAQGGTGSGRAAVAPRTGAGAAKEDGAPCAAAKERGAKEAKERVAPPRDTGDARAKQEDDSPCAKAKKDRAAAPKSGYPEMGPAKGGDTLARPGRNDRAGAPKSAYSAAKPVVRPAAHAAEPAAKEGGASSSRPVREERAPSAGNAHSGAAPGRTGVVHQAAPNSPQGPDRLPTELVLIVSSLQPEEAQDAGAAPAAGPAGLSNSITHTLHSLAPDGVSSSRFGL